MVAPADIVISIISNDSALGDAAGGTSGIFGAPAPGTRHAFQMRISAQSHFLKIAFAAECYTETIHFAFLVSWNAQFSCLLYQHCCSRFAIVLYGANKHEKAIVDCADDLLTDLDADPTYLL